jgi:hypothetical protein
VFIKQRYLGFHSHGIGTDVFDKIETVIDKRLRIRSKITSRFVNAKSECRGGFIRRGRLKSPLQIDSLKFREVIFSQVPSEPTLQWVKKMVQAIIREHPGWLVAWVGIFGGLMGPLSVFA